MIKPNKHIISLEPYSITEQDVWLGKDKSKILKLDWNEAPEDHEFLREELRNIINQKGILSWYPDYNCTEITKIVAFLTLLNVCPMNTLIPHFEQLMVFLFLF